MPYCRRRSTQPQTARDMPTADFSKVGHAGRTRQRDPVPGERCGECVDRRATAGKRTGLATVCPTLRPHPEERPLGRVSKDDCISPTHGSRRALQVARSPHHEVEPDYPALPQIFFFLPKAGLAAGAPPSRLALAT